VAAAASGAPALLTQSLMSAHKDTACRIEAVGVDEHGIPDLRVDCPNRKVAPTVETCLACNALTGMEGTHATAAAIVCRPEEADVDAKECVPTAPCLPQPTFALPHVETQVIRVRKGG
jgi:hypothetical protein